MTFPTIKYKATGTELQTHLQQLVAEKFKTLEKYTKVDTGATCEVEFAKAAPQQHGEVFRFEANVWIKGKLYRAEATESNFEKAIAEVRNELDSEMLRFHKRKENMIRRGGRKIKEMLRFGK